MRAANNYLILLLSSGSAPYSVMPWVYSREGCVGGQVTSPHIAYS